MIIEKVDRQPHGVETIKERVGRLSLERSVKPSVFGFSLESSERINQKFLERVLVETDISEIVEGVIPPELVIDPSVSILNIETDNGLVEIKKLGKLRKAIGNQVRRFLALVTESRLQWGKNKIEGNSQKR